jgi:uncharacterized membrane protein YhdT
MRYSKSTPVKGVIVWMAILANAIVIRNGFVKEENWYWALCLTVPMLLIVSSYKNSKKKCNHV